MTDESRGENSPPDPGENDVPEETSPTGYETTLRHRLAVASDRVQQRRGSSRTVDSLFLIRDRNRVLPASLLVGALASRIVVYLVPLFALVIFSFGLYDEYTGQSAEEAARAAGMPALVAQAAEESTSLHQGWKIFGLLATAGAVLYAANSLGRLLRRSTALIWGVPYPRLSRPWALPFAVIVVSLVAWAITALSSSIEDWNVDLFVGVTVVEFFALVVFWLVITWFLPRSPEARRWGVLVPGSLFFAFGVVGLRVAMVVYFSNTIEHLSDRYGSIAIALIMLTWAYWLGMVVVGSAEINAALFATGRMKRDREGPAQG